jgi:hypothetical protein
MSGPIDNLSIQQKVLLKLRLIQDAAVVIASLSKKLGVKTNAVFSIPKFHDEFWVKFNIPGLDNEEGWKLIYDRPFTFKKELESRFGIEFEGSCKKEDRSEIRISFRNVIPDEDLEIVPLDRGVMLDQIFNVLICNRLGMQSSKSGRVVGSVNTSLRWVQGSEIYQTFSLNIPLRSLYLKQNIFGTEDLNSNDNAATGS